MSTPLLYLSASCRGWASSCLGFFDGTGRKAAELQRQVVCLILLVRVSVSAHCCTHVAGERLAGHTAVLTKALGCQAWRAAGKWAMPAHAGCWGYHWTHAAQGLPRAVGTSEKSKCSTSWSQSVVHTTDTQSVGNAQAAGCEAVAFWAVMRNMAWVLLPCCQLLPVDGATEGQ